MWIEYFVGYSREVWVEEKGFWSWERYLIILIYLCIYVNLVDYSKKLGFGKYYKNLL